MCLLPGATFSTSTSPYVSVVCVPCLLLRKFGKVHTQSDRMHLLKSLLLFFFPFPYPFEADKVE